MDRNFLNLSENIKDKIILTCLKEKTTLSHESNKNLFPPQYDLVQFLKYHEEQYVEEVNLLNTFGLYAWKDLQKPCNSHSHDILCIKIPRLVVVASETSSGKTRIILSLCLISKPRERKQITFNLFSEILFPIQCALNCTLIVCLNTLVHQWVDEARKIGIQNILTCNSSNQDLSSLLQNCEDHKICIMSSNMLKNYTNFLTSHTFTRVVFDEVDAKNCTIQFVANSLILVSATVLELLDSLGREYGSQFSKNSLYGQIKYFLFSSRLPVVTIDRDYLNKFMKIPSIQEAKIFTVEPFITAYLKRFLCLEKLEFEHYNLIYTDLNATSHLIAKNVIFNRANTIQEKIEEQLNIYKPSHFLIIIQFRNQYPSFFEYMDKVYDISRGQATSIQKKITEWNLNGGGLVLNIEQGTIAGLNLPAAEILFFIESKSYFQSGTTSKLIQAVNRAQRFGRKTRLKLFKIRMYDQFESTKQTIGESDWNINQDLKLRLEASNNIILNKQKAKKCRYTISDSNEISNNDEDDDEED